MRHFSETKEDSLQGNKAYLLQSTICFFVDCKTQNSNEI